MSILKHQVWLSPGKEHDISLWSWNWGAGDRGAASYTVLYGLHQESGLDYSHACSLLGAAIMHRTLFDGGFGFDPVDPIPAVLHPVVLKKNGKPRFKP